MKKVIVLVIMFTLIAAIHAEQYLNNSRLIDKENIESIGVETVLLTIDDITKSNETEIKKLIDRETFLYLSNARDYKRLKKTFHKHENVILSNLTYDNDRVLLQGKYYYIGNFVPSDISDYKVGKKYDVYTLFNVVYLISK